MTYETFVKEMIEWFPFLRTQCSDYMEEDDPLPYLAIGCVFIPWLETCLEIRETAEIAKACDFIEATADAGRSDSRLDDLIGIQIGEWLPGAKDRKLLLSHFGPNTQKACSYHISRLSD